MRCGGPTDVAPVLPADDEAGTRQGIKHLRADGDLDPTGCVNARCREAQRVRAVQIRTSHPVKRLLIRRGVEHGSVDLHARGLLQLVDAPGAFGYRRHDLEDEGFRRDGLR